MKQVRGRETLWPLCINYNIKLLQVTLCGAGSPLGESMALLLKQSPMIKCLDLYEEKHNLSGQIIDLFAIETSCKVRGFVGPECLTAALAVRFICTLLIT